MSRNVVAAVVAALMVIGVLVLRERTMTRHEPRVPGTATEIVVEAATNARAASTTTEFTRALIGICRLEVDAELVSEPERVSDQHHRYRLVLAPALDEFDERQIHGCLEDARVNHLQLEVLTLRRLQLPAS